MFSFWRQSGGRTRNDRAMFGVRALFGATLFATVVVLGIAACLMGLEARDSARFLVLNLVAGGAAGFTGGLLGFIFGVPKSLADPDAVSRAEASGVSRPNTNLEQISDWLTKILVGAGLTSLTALPGFAASVIQYLDTHAYEGLGGTGGGTLAVFIMVYFAAGTFFWSYIETRTTLTQLFNASNGSIEPDLLRVARLAPSEPGSPPIPADADILRLPANSLNTVELLDARGSAEIRAGNAQGAIEMLQRALRMAPSNLPLQRKLALVLSSAGRTAEAETLIADAHAAAERAGSTSDKNRLALDTLFNALYKPNGYDEAIRIGTDLLTTDLASNGNLRFWLARAYGQKAKSLDPQSSDFAAARLSALENLRQMKAVRPDLLALARAVWQPDRYQGKRDENDLEVFRDDPEFAAVLT